MAPSHPGRFPTHAHAHAHAHAHVHAHTHSAATTRNRPPGTASASVIPNGIVHRKRGEFEARISAQGHHSDLVLMTRALNYTRNNIYGTNMTYMGRLRVAEHLGLSNLTASLAEFIRVHDDMSRALARTYQISMRVQRRATVDILTQIEIRIFHMQNTVFHADIVSTLNGTLLQTMRVAGNFDTEAFALRDLLVDEFARVLTSWDDHSSDGLEDHELENVGPNSDINTLGQDVEAPQTRFETITGSSIYLSTPSSSSTTFTDALMNETDDEYDDEDDDRHRCSICIEQYTTSAHRAFRLTACGHTFGKTCISNWVNSVARNANTCPQCRVVLCPRRPRRPIGVLHGQVLPPRPDQAVLQARLDRITCRFRHLSDVYATLWGATSGNAFYDTCIIELNWRFFTQDLRWQIVPDELFATGLKIRRVNWHA